MLLEYESVVTAQFSRNQVSPLLHSPTKIQIHWSVSIIHLVSNSQVYILNSTPGSWRAALGHLGPGGNFSTRRRWGWGGGMVSGWLKRYIYCALYFYDDYISSASDHQSWGPGGRGSLLQRTFKPSILQTAQSLDGKAMQKYPRNTDGYKVTDDESTSHWNRCIKT